MFLFQVHYHRTRPSGLLFSLKCVGHFWFYVALKIPRRVRTGRVCAPRAFLCKEPPPQPSCRENRGLRVGFWLKCGVRSECSDRQHCTADLTRNGRRRFTGVNYRILSGLALISNFKFRAIIEDLVSPILSSSFRLWHPRVTFEGAYNLTKETSSCSPCGGTSVEASVWGHPCGATEQGGPAASLPQPGEQGFAAGVCVTGAPHPRDPAHGTPHGSVPSAPPHRLDLCLHQPASQMRRCGHLWAPSD